MVLINFFTELKRFSEQLCLFGRLSDAGFSVGFFAMCMVTQWRLRNRKLFIAVEVVRVDGNFLPCWPPQRARTTAYSPPASATVLFHVKTGFRSSCRLLDSSPTSAGRFLFGGWRTSLATV